MLHYKKAQFNILITILACLVLYSCNKKEGPFAPQVQPFFIHNLGVTFDTWKKDTGLAGDFFFTAEFHKIFLEFGARVVAYDGSIKELPTFEYVIKKDASVFAIAEGEVVGLAYQENTRDYEFSVRSTRDPAYFVVYDHVTNCPIAVGDYIQPGDTLGNPGTATEMLGRFEIMINNYKTGLSYCPLNFLADEHLETFKRKIAQFIKDWEEFKNDTTIYDEENYALPGCRYESMITY